MNSDLLVVAGEPSGDRMAARVLERVSLPSWGMGGPEIAGRVGDLVVDARELGVMGTTDVLSKVPRMLAALRRIVAEARRRRPRSALLVGYSEFNARLGPSLRELGARVVWYGAPQIWAWRAGRARSLGRACDRMAVILPFEPRVWRAHGVLAEYVGHPSLERRFLPRPDARAKLGCSADGLAIAVLPGSRPGEVRRLLDAMLSAVERFGARRPRTSVHVFASNALPSPTRDQLGERVRNVGAHLVEERDLELLSGFDLAVAASGTVTLECALAGVPPLIVYRTDAASAFLARRWMTVEHVGLPNLLLGTRRFPELLQGDVRPDRMAHELEHMLIARPALVAEAARVRSELGPERRPSQRVAELLVS